MAGSTTVAAHERVHPCAVKAIDHGGFKWFAPGDWVLVDNPWSGPTGEKHGGHHPHFDEQVMRKVVAVVARPESEDEPHPTPAPAIPEAVIRRVQPPPPSLLRAFSGPFFPGE